MKTKELTETGSQRLTLAQLKAWEALKYGMFIHFGMSTYDGVEISKGDQPSALYAPDRLDVDQWISVARDAGMKYAILTTKHAAGHALWPTRFNDYHVGTSGNKTDVVKAFVEACRKRGVMPGLYYCSLDNHNVLFDTPPWPRPAPNYGVTPQFEEFQWNQITELLSQYGEVGEIWIDIPHALTSKYRHDLYWHMAELQPKAVIMMNHGIGDGAEFKVQSAWPTDLIAIERCLPNSHTKHVKWREIDGKKYYMPGEVCDPIGGEWFHVDNDFPRSDAELLGMYLVTVSRGCNLLLDVPPNRHGIIEDFNRKALMRLRKNLDLLGFDDRTGMECDEDQETPLTFKVTDQLTVST